MKAISVFIVLLSFSLTSNAASLTNLYQQQEDRDTLVISPVEYKGLPILPHSTPAFIICGSLGYKRLVSAETYERQNVTEYAVVEIDAGLYFTKTKKSGSGTTATEVYKEIRCTR